MLIRRFGTTPFGVFGELVIEGRVFYTVERPWVNNKPRVSCVPNGQYKLLWRQTTCQLPAEYDGYTWYLDGGSVGLDEGHRTRIALHVGNIQDDLEGCIAVGKRLSFLNGNWAVADSNQAMGELLDIVGRRDSSLTVLTKLCG